MNHNNYANHGSLRKRLVLIAALLTLSLAAFAAFVQQASALELFTTVTTGDNEFFFRDVNNLSNSSATISLGDSDYRPGDTVTLTITDINANSDIFSQETLLDVKVSSSDPVGILIDLTESGINTGVFVGTFTLTSGPSSGTALHVENNDGIIVAYEPQPTFAGRFSAQLSGVDVDGFAFMADYVVTEEEEVNNCFVVVTDAVDFQLIEDVFGIPIALGGTTVTMSFANAVIGGNVGSPKIFNQAVPEGLWLPVASSIDLGAKTITTTAPISTGKFVVGFTNACGGGGAGGLVRPGLVLNFLAGMDENGAGRGVDKSPPSLALSRPTGFITSALSSLVFDPLSPISPTQDMSSAPLEINGMDYNLQGTYSNTIAPAEVNTGELVNMALSFADASQIKHLALYFIDESSDEISDTAPRIIYDNGNVEKHDPDGILGTDINFETTKDGTKTKFNFGFSFADATDRHLMMTVWDENRNAANMKIFDAFAVSGEPIPNQESHMIPIQNHGVYNIISNKGAFEITRDGAETEPAELEPKWYYADSIGRTDRHDTNVLYDLIDYEQDKANSITIQQFKLDTKLFATDNHDKSNTDLERAPQLTWSNVGHKLRDLANTSENKELIQKLLWDEHLKAEKTLASLTKTHRHY